MFSYPRSLPLIRWAASEGIALGGIFGLGYGIAQLVLTISELVIAMVINHATVSDTSLIATVLFFGLPVVFFGCLCGAIIGMLAGAFLGCVFALIHYRTNKQLWVYVVTTISTLSVVISILWLTDGWKDYTFRIFPGLLMLPASWLLTSRFLQQRPT